MNASATARSPWPFAIVGFFIIAIMGIVTFVVFAARNGMDLVSPDYYERELRFQGRLNSMNRTAGLSGRVRLAYNAKASNLEVALPLLANTSKVTGNVELYRPSDSSLDRSLKLEPDEEGRESLRVEGIRPGLWKVRVTWSSGGEEYFDEQTLIIDSHLARGK